MKIDRSQSRLQIPERENTSECPVLKTWGLKVLGTRREKKGGELALRSRKSSMAMELGRNNSEQKSFFGALNLLLAHKEQWESSEQPDRGVRETIPPPREKARELGAGSRPAPRSGFYLQVNEPNGEVLGSTVVITAYCPTEQFL